MLMKYSDKENEHGFDEGHQYFGEWSSITKRPHGRGIEINDSFDVYFGYFINGIQADGRYVNIFSIGEFRVGEITHDSKGTKRNKWTNYWTNGTTK